MQSVADRRNILGSFERYHRWLNIQAAERGKCVRIPPRGEESIEDRSGHRSSESLGKESLTFP